MSCPHGNHPDECDNCDSEIRQWKLGYESQLKELQAMREERDALLARIDSMNQPTSTHTLEEDYQHFLCYSGAEDSATRLRMAYEHGNDRGMQLTQQVQPKDENDK